MTSPRILLTDTTRWPSAARLAIRLAKAGVNVSALCMTRGQPLQNTGAVRRIFRYSALRPLHSLIAAIEASDPLIIIPCDDRALLHLHELHCHAEKLRPSGRNIQALIERSLGSPESYAVTSGRYKLLSVALEAGLSVPFSQRVRTTRDLHSWCHDFPCALKADGTFGGRGVRIVNSLQEAQEALRELSELFSLSRAVKRLILNRDPFWLRPWWNGVRPSVIAQSYIHGFPGNCAVFSWKGKVLSGICVDVVRTQGLTDPATVVRVVHRPEMMHAAETLASRLKLSGFFGLDFMIEEKTGIAYLIEMNPRTTPLSHLQLGSGRDMVGALSSRLSGRPLVETPPITLNEMIAYFPQACDCGKELLAESFLDIPTEEPALVQELLSPWPQRSRLFQMMLKLEQPQQFLGTLFSCTRSIRSAWATKVSRPPAKPG